MFLERPWYLSAVSIFTNQLFLLILCRTILGHKCNFLFLGLQEKKESSDVFRNHKLLPHAYIFIANMVIVMFLANSEINARVASTCPFYYFAFSQLIVEVHEEMKTLVNVKKLEGN